MVGLVAHKKTGTLRDSLLRRIETDGPIGIDQYMNLALGDPYFGYYMTRDPLGGAGDFITAPEVSQMFGEIIGLWLASEWQRMGSPDPVRLVELGPGRGTLMTDALRAMAVVPGILEAADLHMVETSPVLMAEQQKRMDACWHGTLAQVPVGPTLLVANEFFDALPVQQFIMTDNGWRERCVGAEDGELVFTTGERAVNLSIMRPLGDGGTLGDIFEASPAGTAVMAEIAGRLVNSGGAALIIDYGHTKHGLGDTLQAVRDHQFSDVLARPGEADLTAHVDFAALKEEAIGVGASAHGPVTQGAFLALLGIRERAEKLEETASPSQKRDILAALKRLTGSNALGAMGDLFKVMAITDPGAPPPAGFE